MHPEFWRKMMLNGSVILYNKSSILEKDIALIKTEGFEVARVDCADLDESAFHKKIAKTLMFPAYYGENLNAFDDCLSDIEPENTGILLVFENYDAFLGENPAFGYDVLQVIQLNAWQFLISEKGLMSFVQSNDPALRIPAIGGLVPQWNNEEWLDKARGL